MLRTFDGSRSARDVRTASACVPRRATVAHFYVAPGSAIDRRTPRFGTERALVLLLRYSGVRIGDAISLTSDRIKENQLFLYTLKTGTPVNTVLPDLVLVRARSLSKSD